MSRKKNKSLLWRLKGANGNKGYLFGTIHIAHDDIEDDFPKLLKLIKKSDVFYAETDLDAISNMKVEYEDVQEAHKIKNIFSDKKIHRLFKLLQSQQFYSEDILREMHAMTIYKFLVSATLKSDDVIFPDYIFWSFARNNMIERQGIESIDFQMDIGDNYSVKELKKMLNAIIDKPNKPIRELNKLMRIYMSEDIHHLQSHTKKSLGKMRKKLLYDRNITMSEKIIDIVDGEKSFFITLGAGHLGGKKGIISYLKKNNIKLKPIKWK